MTPFLPPPKPAPTWWANSWMQRLGLCALSLGCSLPGLAVQPPCPIPGETIHWVADYCMASIGTDDEIAASDCINRELARKFDSACQAKTYFKRSLCRLLHEHGTIQGGIEQCVNDPAVQGRTVRQGGVGG